MVGLVDAPAVGESVDELQPPSAGLLVIHEMWRRCGAVVVDDLESDAPRVARQADLHQAVPVEQSIGDKLAHQEHDHGHIDIGRPGSQRAPDDASSSLDLPVVAGEVLCVLVFLHRRLLFQACAR